MDLLGDNAPFISQFWYLILPVILVLLGYWYLSNLQNTPNQRNLQNNKREARGELFDEDNHVFMDRDEEIHAADDDPMGHQSQKQIPYEPVIYEEEDMVKRSQEFYHLMNKRRTVRFFSDKPVPREVIDNIIHAAGTAPSGAHTEPWTFVVVSNKEIKSEIRRTIEYEEHINYEKRMGETWVNDLQKLQTTWEKPYLDMAPYLIVIFRQTHGFWPNGERKNHYYGEISSCIYAGILLCAIQNAGLVTLTSTPMNAGPRLRKLLNRPAEEKVLLLLPVGYAADDVTVPDLHRKKLDEIIIHV